MCTGFIVKDNDLLFAFNMDLDPEAWSYDIYKTDSYFTVGIKVGSRVYYTHGVNRNGNFGNLPYMNGEDMIISKGVKRQRIDLLIDKYIRGKRSYDDVLDILETKTLVNIPACSMHSLVGDRDDHILLLEPGYGTKEIKDDFGVIANFPIQANLKDFNNPFYGKDRYDKVKRTLSKRKKNFGVKDAMKLLESVKQEGKWATRVSFVYSRNENRVYYCLENDFSNIQTHEFKQL